VQCIDNKAIHNTVVPWSTDLWNWDRQSLNNLRRPNDGQYAKFNGSTSDCMSDTFLAFE